MAMFFVRFSYGRDRKMVEKPMRGANRRCVAREVRERYPDAEITAIKAFDWSEARKVRSGGEMTAEYFFADDESAGVNLRFAIREELLAADKENPERIFAAARMPVPDLSRRMGISFEEAFAMRKAARKWICDAWNFEDAAGMRGVLWVGELVE